MLVLAFREWVLAAWVARCLPCSDVRKLPGLGDWWVRARALLPGAISSWIKVARTRGDALICMMFLGDAEFVNLRLCAEYAGTAVQVARPAVVRLLPTSLRSAAQEGQIGGRTLTLSIAVALACGVCGILGLVVIYAIAGKTPDTVLWASVVGCVVGGFFALAGYANRAMIVAGELVQEFNVLAVLLTLIQFALIVWVADSGITAYFFSLAFPFVILACTPLLIRRSRAK